MGNEGDFGFWILDFGLRNAPRLNSPSEFNGVKIAEWGMKAILDFGLRNADCKNRETKECDNHYLSKQWVKGREYETVGKGGVVRRSLGQ